MRTLRTLAGLAVLTVPMFAAAEARTPMRDLFCAELRRMIEAATEEPAFASLVADGPVLPGFEQGCTIRGEGWHRRLRCSSREAVADGGLDRLAARTAACLPHAIRMAEPPRSPVVRFREGSVAILIEPAPPDEGGPALAYSLFAVPVH